MKHRKIRRKQHPRRQIQRKTPAAIMKIPAPAAQPWRLNNEEIELVKKHIAPGTTDAELAFCLAVARRHKLDPFRGQIWFVPRSMEQNNQRVKKWLPIVGINGLLHIAARDHKDFGTISEPEYGPTITVTYRVNGQGQERNLPVPEWARVDAWKKGFERPTVARVEWAEIYRNIDYSPMVRQMPKHMLGKCAMAQAIRKAWPASDGLYIAEEMPEGPPDFTPGGRRIIRPEMNDGQTLDLPPVQEDQNVKNYLARLSPEERAAEEAAMARKTASVPSTEAGNGGTTREGDRSARTRRIVRYRYFNDTQSARIVQPAPGIITADLKAILRKFVKASGYVELNNEELEAVKYEFEKRGIDLKPLPREAGE